MASQYYTMVPVTVYPAQLPATSYPAPGYAYPPAAAPQAPPPPNPTNGGPSYYRTAPIPQHTSYTTQNYYRQAWASSPAGLQAQSDAAAAKKKADDESAAALKKKSDEAAATAIAAAGWTTMYFSGGEDTRQTMLRAGLNGVSCDVGEWKWVGEPGNGGFRICEVRKKKDVQPPREAEGFTPALAWHLMQGVQGPPSWGLGRQHGPFEPPRPSGGPGGARYAGQGEAVRPAQGFGGGYNYGSAGASGYGYACQCAACVGSGAHASAHMTEMCGCRACSYGY